jgi:hypothetical protein
VTALWVLAILAAGSVSFAAGLWLGYLYACLGFWQTRPTPRTHELATFDPWWDG